MAEFARSRNIVNKGIILLSESDREVSQYQIYGQVERFPIETGLNNRYPIPQSFYGYVQGLFRGYVVWTVPIQYPNQIIREESDVELQKFASHVCLHQITYDQLYKVAFLNLVHDNPPKHPLALQAARIGIDMVAVKLLPGCTYVITFLGKRMNIPCDNPVEWVEPAGPPDNGGDPRNPAAPPSQVPVNPFDPNGWDLPSEPYDRETDDGGYSYDPEREGDQEPEPLPRGRYKMLITVQPMGGDPPVPSGPSFVSELGLPGDACVVNPRVGEYLNNGAPYPTSFSLLWENPDGSSGGFPNSGGFGGRIDGVEFVKIGEC